MRTPEVPTSAFMAPCPAVGVSEAHKEACVPKVGLQFRALIISFVFGNRKIFLTCVGVWAGAGQGPNDPPFSPSGVVEQWPGPPLGLSAASLLWVLDGDSGHCIRGLNMSLQGHCQTTLFLGDRTGEGGGTAAGLATCEAVAVGDSDNEWLQAKVLQLVDAHLLS